jgi:ABC-type bacteriocin/lantibiotic exporter with double-glycine peptidase domain
LISASGDNLSRGQRQLVLIAAAVASERPIVLLDASLANLDRIRRRRLLESELFAGKTVVFVDHEPS